MTFKWSYLFRSERARVKPVLMEDATPAQPPDPQIEEQRDRLGLMLMEAVVRSASISGELRRTVATEVAAKIQGRL
jgi:hypothetical protein